MDLMENTIAELKKAIPFKDSTVIGDIVLFVNENQEENGPLGVSYAHITDFVRDTTKRDEWWHVHMAFLVVPPQPQVLILQTPHFTGQETFTIGGKKVFIKALDFSALSEKTMAEKRDKPASSTPEKKKGGLTLIKGKS
jgi:hypothetical protein